MKIFIKIISIKYTKIFGKKYYSVNFLYTYKAAFKRKHLYIPIAMLNSNELSEVRSSLVSSAVISRISEFINSLDWSYLEDNANRAVHLSFCNLLNLEEILPFKVVVKV